VTDIHDSAPELPVSRASQQDIIEAINRRRRERELATKKPYSSSPNTPQGRPGSLWYGSRPVEGHALDRHLSGLLRLPTSPSPTISPICKFAVNLFLAWFVLLLLTKKLNEVALFVFLSLISLVAMPVSVQVTPNNPGLKIRIPRDLPNLPEVFRKRGAIRSIPISTGSGQGTIKRTHSQMMLGEPNGKIHNVSPSFFLSLRLLAFA
jgi:hypothetical protein